MRADGRIDYIEFPGTDLSKAKEFYAAAFGWTFTDYGPDYAAFDGAATDGGFNGHEGDAHPAPLVILYAHDLEAMQAKIEAAGGKVVRATRSFPGGRRFHFSDPCGNILGVWSTD